MSTPNLAYFTVAQTREVVPLCTGIPGVAKTKSVEAFARALGRKVYTLIGSIREPADIGGYPYPGEGADGAKVMFFLRAEWLDKMWQDHARDIYSVLFVDELTTCPPACQAAMLRIPAERKVGEHDLPPSTLVCMACNPPGIAANGVELEPPMANRLCHLPWVVDWDAWDRGMQNGGRFPEPKFSLLPDDWKNHLPQAGSMMAAFRQHRPTLFEDYPKDDRSKAGGPWPSPRSWHNAAICAAACQSISDDPALVGQVIRGCVGDVAEGQYTTWRDSLDLPDTEQMVTKAMADRKAGREVTFPELDRADKRIVVLSNIVGRVMHHKKTLPRWEAAIALFHAAYHRDGTREIAVAQVPPLFEGAELPKGAKLLEGLAAEFVKEVAPLMAASGLLDGR